MALIGRIEERTTFNDCLQSNDLLSNQPASKNKAIFPTFITTLGLKNNEYSNELIQNKLTMDDLFL